VLGIGGSGKTVLVGMLEDELRQRGRSTFYVPLHGVGRPGQVGSRILRTVYDVVPHAFVGGRVLQSSAGGPATSEILEDLREAGSHLTRPVLILDGLDEAADPAGTASTVEELSRALMDWQIVVSSRPTGVESRFDHLAVVEVGSLAFDEAVTLLRGLIPESTNEQISEAFAISGGHVLALRILAKSGIPHRFPRPTEPWTQSSIEHFVMSAIDRDEIVRTTGTSSTVDSALPRRAPATSGGKPTRTAGAATRRGAEAARQPFKAACARRVRHGKHGAVNSHRNSFVSSSRTLSATSSFLVSGNTGVKVTASKKSAARMAAACDRRKVAQLSEALWSRVYPGVFEDFPDRGRGDLHAQDQQLAVDAPVPPGVVLVGQA